MPEDSACNFPGSEFVVHLVDSSPSYTRQYPIPEALKQKVRERIDEWKKRKWVRELKGERNPWNTLLLAVPKKSGGKIVEGDIRLCLDFRAVNEKTCSADYTVPLASTMFAKTRGAIVFSELDLSNAFHQIRTEEKSAYILEFTNLDGTQCVWQRMPFGPKNACTHFQKLGERAAEGAIKSRENLCVYVDNFLVASRGVAEHIEHLKDVISSLTKAGFKLNPKKCKIGYRRIQFMGCIIDGESRALDEHKVQQFLDLQKPKNGKQVESLLGFTNFLRKFIPNYLDVTGPLERL